MNRNKLILDKFIPIIKKEVLEIIRNKKYLNRIYRFRKIKKEEPFLGIAYPIKVVTENPDGTVQGKFDLSRMSTVKRILASTN